MTAEGDHRQAQASRPTLRALVQRGRPRLGQIDPRRRQQFACLANTEARSLPRSSATSPASLSWCSLIGGSRRDDNTTCAGSGGELEQLLELGAGVSGTRLVEIVDHQHNDSGRFGQFRYNRVDNHIAVKIGRSGLPSGISDGIRSPDRLQDGEPELRILLVAGHRHEGDPASSLARSDHAISSDVFPLPEAPR